MNRVCQLVGLLTLALPWALPLSAAEAAVGDVLNTPAMHAPQAEHAVLLDLARAGARLVAVGERGIVLLSDDNGNTWRQAPVPVSVSLTAVQFVDAEHGWAVGHGGAVLVSADAGETWTLQLDGRRAAQLELDAARAEAAYATASDADAARVQNAERLVAEGADKPFLALKFSDARHGLIVGAYGLAFKTADGGASWQSLIGQIDNPAGAHLYALAAHGAQWFIAGEQGYLARSDDGGQSFASLDSPYSGSFFAAQVRDDGTLLVAGLKGNAFVSGDNGGSFVPAPVPMPVSFSDAIRTVDGQLLLVNQGGALFRTQADAQLQPYGAPLGKPVASVVQAADGSLVLAGFTGLTRLAPPTAIASE
ncbi:BNR domain-containing protein [Pseudomonas moraviensis subsp. stanleyae]|uniref:WD40/YVTN/BNR-like repeat-containing protein n=1 Tax=Pseudomonas moraviensis TaxID=321662 RepID=UPI002E30A864|nr:YCF48-related protein [Pseudomonas moraviensis]MED7669792.1 BNR domain-containing protein [Pseudomonas moraviensis subsp. stanleyae]